MLGALSKWWQLRFIRQPQASSSSEKKALNGDLDDTDIPRYPPFAKGLPAAPLDKVLATQRELALKIKQSLGFSDEEADTLLFPVVRNYAAFVHLLPASEGHHHRGAGGLFRHGLEVAFWATQASEAIIFVPEGTPEEKQQKEPRWRFAVFLGALMHDLGKPLSDVVVTDKPGHLEWNPYAETLEEWLAETGVTHYFLRWNKGRHQRHERLATLALNMVLTAEVKRYLRLPGPELMKVLIEAISGTSALNPMAKLIMLADGESVKRDLKESRLSVDGHSLGVSIEPYIIDAIRALVQSGRWRVNCNGAEVWHLTQGTFLSWRVAVDSLVQQLKDNSIPAVPHAPDTLADYLIDRGFALPRPIPGQEDEVEENYYRYWEVTVEVTAEDGAQVAPKVLMLRMEDLSLVFGTSTNPPEPITAVVAGLDANGQLVTQEEEAAKAASDGEAQAESADAEESPPDTRLLEQEGDDDLDDVEDALRALSPTHTSPKTGNRNNVNTINMKKQGGGSGAESTGEEGLGTGATLDTFAIAAISPKNSSATSRQASEQPSSVNMATLSPKGGDADESTTSQEITFNPITGEITSPYPVLDMATLSPGGADAPAPKSQQPKGEAKPTPPKADAQQDAGADDNEMTQEAVTRHPAASIENKAPTTPSRSEASVPGEADGETDAEADNPLEALSNIASALGGDLGMDLPFETPPAPSADDTPAEPDVVFEAMPDDEGVNTTDADANPLQAAVEPAAEAPTAQRQKAKDAPARTQAPADTPSQPPKEQRQRVTPDKGSASKNPNDPVATNTTPKKAGKKKRPKKKPGPSNVTKTPPPLVAVEVPKAPPLSPEQIMAQALGTSKNPAQGTSKPSAPASRTAQSVADDALAMLMPETGRQAAQGKKKTPAKSVPETPRNDTKRSPPSATPTPAVTQAAKATGTADMPASESAPPQPKDAEPLPKSIGDMPTAPERQAVAPIPLQPSEGVDMPALSEGEGESAPSDPDSRVHDDATHDLIEAPTDDAAKEPVSDVAVPDGGPAALLVMPELSFAPSEMDTATPVEPTAEAPIEKAPIEEAPAEAEAPIEADKETAPEADTDVHEHLPPPSGTAEDIDHAENLMTQLVAPILAGRGVLGQTLLRADGGGFVVLVEPAAELLKQTRTELVMALCLGGVIDTSDALLSDQALPLHAETTRWITQRLADQEAEREKALAQLCDGNGEAEAPTISSVVPVSEPIQRPSSSIVRRTASQRTVDASEKVADASAIVPDVKDTPVIIAPRHTPSPTVPDEDDGGRRDGDWEEDDRDGEVVISPPKMSAKEAIGRLKSMILEGEGPWIYGSVTREGDYLAVSDYALDIIAKDYPDLTRVRLRSAAVAGRVGMNIVTKDKKIYVLAN